VVTLPGNVSDDITFTALAGTAGNYSVEIGGTPGKFDVMPQNLAWLWITLGTGIPLVMLVAAFITYRVRSTEE
jgi:hypothetical protein